MGDGSDDKESLLAVEFQNVAKKLVEREQEMKQKYIDLKKKYEDDQSSLLSHHTLELKQKENEIHELKKVNVECLKRIKFYQKRFLGLDERVFMLEETAKEFKSGNLENNNDKQQKAFAAAPEYESCSGLALSNEKRDSNKITKTRLPEIIEIDDDDDDNDAEYVSCISTLKRKRDSNEVKKEHNSDDNDLEYKSTLTTNREIKRECNSDKVDETYKHILAKLKKEKEMWESEADMLKEFEKNDALSINAICALYRQRANIHDQSDISRINQLARMLFNGDSQKSPMKRASELDRIDVHHIRMLAKKYSARIFDIYQKKIDPFFRPRS